MFTGGGAFDLAFIGSSAYALITLVTPEVGGSGVDGIYRIDGPNSFTLVADIGAFNRANPPETDFFVPTGVLFALEPYRGGFLVTDGHLNRVLYVTRDGEITVFRAFDNIVPTGLDVSGQTVYMAEAGPLPQLPEDGKVVAFGPKSPTVAEVASGARLAVDVEFGRGRTLFALSQGLWRGVNAGEPALPNTGALMGVNGDGTLTTIIDGLNQPTSLEIIKNTAYVVTLGGETGRSTTCGAALRPDGREQPGGEREYWRGQQIERRKDAKTTGGGAISGEAAPTPASLARYISGTNMMCALGVPAPMIHGVPRAGLSESPVVCAVAKGM